jgi:hypothetical protein
MQVGHRAMRSWGRTPSTSTVVHLDAWDLLTDLGSHLQQLGLADGRFGGGAGG